MKKVTILVIILLCITILFIELLHTTVPNKESIEQIDLELEDSSSIYFYKREHEFYK